MVKELRGKSNAPMMDCKKALTEVDGDISKAMDWLRAKGIAKANQGNRTATEGLIGLYSKDSKISIVEINSETDFVARNVDFQSFVALIAATVHSHEPTVGDMKIEELLTLPPAGNLSKASNIKEALGDITSAIRENIIIRRAYSMNTSLTTGKSTVLTQYVHGLVGDEAILPKEVQLGKSASIISLSLSPSLSQIPSLSDNTRVSVLDTLTQSGRKLAMHVVAAHTNYLKMEDIPEEEIERETAIIREQTETEAVNKETKRSTMEKEREKMKKKERERETDAQQAVRMKERIMTARLAKRLSEMCLLTQTHMAEEGGPIVDKFIQSLSKKITEEIKTEKNGSDISMSISVDSFCRWTLGQHQVGEEK